MAGVRIRHLRWYIGGLLFLSTVINYIDRQTLSVLAPYLKTEYRWSNTDFAWVLIAFRVAYAVGQTVAGRLLDSLGTRRGLSLSVAFYSVAAMRRRWPAVSRASAVSGFRSASARRELAGRDQGRVRVVPAARERMGRRALRQRIVDRRRACPVHRVGVYHWFGSWRPAFILTGSLGFIWLVLFRRVLPPARRPSVRSPAERATILDERASEGANAAGSAATAADRRATATCSAAADVGLHLSKALTDPVWFFITDWFAIYLVSRGFKLEESLVGFWVPFLAADLGNFFGGGVSSRLIPGDGAWGRRASASP